MEGHIDEWRVLFYLFYFILVYDMYKDIFSILLV